jgi:hypothetical protein
LYFFYFFLAPQEKYFVSSQHPMNLGEAFS